MAARRKKKAPARVSGVHARAREADKRPQDVRTEAGQEKEAQAEGEVDKGGRPSKFTPEVANAIFEFAKLGYTDAEMAKAMGIGTTTLDRWKQERPDFFEQLKGAKGIADQHVVRSLFEVATGEVRIPAVKINQFEGMAVITPFVERFPPNVEAQKFWLKNRQPDKWRDKVEMDVTTDFAQKLIRARERVLAARKKNKK